MGNALNLALTPPEWFDYPAFGMNTIYKYEGWKPTYFVGVDHRLMREHGQAIADAYAEIPKFVPRPNLDEWTGPNFYRFYHRPGPLFLAHGKPMTYDRLLSGDGIAYSNVMHVAMQIAVWMGFTTLLLIGVEHKPGAARLHFWGRDNGIRGEPLAEWLQGYSEIVWRADAHGVRILNLSEETHVPEYVIPRGHWKDWRNT